MSESEGFRLQTNVEGYGIKKTCDRMSFPPQNEEIPRGEQQAASGRYLMMKEEDGNIEKSNA